MTKNKRTDIHRVGAIEPENYRIVLSYALPGSEGGWPVPGVNMDRIAALRAAGVPFADHGGPGKCTVCGATFRYGDVWVHVPTGTHIHVGQDCAAKYELIADRRDFERELDATRVRSAREHQAAIKAEARAEFLAGHPGLAEALQTDHRIVRDIASRFEVYGTLSPAQVALVLRLATEAATPRPEEAHVPAPEGRQTVRGRVVSVKTHEGDWGPSLKVTIKVETPAGSWLAWGTLPAALADAGAARPEGADWRGAEIEFVATLARGRDAHFALFKRPTGGPRPRLGRAG